MNPGTFTPWNIACQSKWTKDLNSKLGDLSNTIHGGGGGVGIPGRFYALLMRFFKNVNCIYF